MDHIHGVLRGRSSHAETFVTGQCQNFVLAQLFGVADRSRDVAIGVAFGDGLSSVL
jgi:hypothetical protein